MQAGQDSDGGVGGTEKMCTLHAVTVVVFVVGKVWRIVPCVYKIYTLDRFQFHGLLKNNPIRFSGGGKYELLGVCFFYGC